MRGLWSTIALIVVLAGLGAYIYFVESKRPQSGLEDKQKVFTVESDKIEEITITSDKETTAVRKSDGTWQLTAPVQTDADQTEISSLTTNLATLEVNRVIDENASNLAEYGLADPRTKVAFKAQGGLAGEVHLGDKTATQSDIYAMKPGEKRVFLVSAFQENTFAKKPFDLRDKRILKFDRDKVDLVQIGQAGPAIEIGRSGSDWVVKQPVQTRADYSAIEGLLTRLSSANMTKIVEDTGSAAAQNTAEGLAKYGLDKPAVTLTLGAGSARTTLTIGKEEEGAVYGRDHARSTVFTIDKTLASDLQKTVDEYRDKDLFEFRSFNAARLRITRGTETYEFQRVAGTGQNAAEKWQRVGAGGAATDVDAVKMDDLLTKLTGLRAQSFSATTEGTGLEKPALVVAASYDQGKFERVRLTKSGADAYALRDGEPGAAKLDASAYDETIKALDAVLAPATPPSQ